jgi:uncharacterized coiled-coil DUF342 family protein
LIKINFIIISTNYRIGNSIYEKREALNGCYKRTDRINSLKEKLNELKKKQTELVMRSQKKSQLVEKCDELQRELEDAKAEVGKLNEQLKSAVRSLNELVKERESSGATDKEALDKRYHFNDELKQIYMKIKDLNHSIEVFEKNDQSKLDSIRKEIKSIESEEKQVNYKQTKSLIIENLW